MCNKTCAMMFLTQEKKKDLTTSGVTRYCSSKSLTTDNDLTLPYVQIRKVPTIRPEHGQYDPISTQLWRPLQHTVLCLTRSAQVGPVLFPLHQHGSRQDRTDTMATGRYVMRLGYMGLPSNPIIRKALFHLHSILLPRGFKQLSSQFCPPITAPNTHPGFISTA